MAISKSDLVVKGTLVTVDPETAAKIGATSETPLLVVDLYDRPNFNKPGRIAVKRYGTNLAVGVDLVNVVVLP